MEGTGLAKKAFTPPGRYQPTIIIHGGAGAITRANLPPDLYQKYYDSLSRYLKESKALLDTGVSALNAACHAVSLMEDDPLFNCGRGSVFTAEGTIEMEASVMVASVNKAGPPSGSIKRGAAVSLIRQTRHPILLAKEVLLTADEDEGLGGTATMHCHLSGSDVEKWGRDERGLEKKPKDWFWTKRRWEEHRRGLEHRNLEKSLPLLGGDIPLPSQGTVGAVCLDTSGNLAVATSTGGLTNKRAGRIGDTPTIGAGFWAESWTDPPDSGYSRWVQEALSAVKDNLSGLYYSLGSCLGLADQRLVLDPSQHELLLCEQAGHRRAVAMSGTGNGDSFLRTGAARTAAAICRISLLPLSEAIKQVAGPGGELQRSAGKRWRKTGEGEGGIIGIEACAGVAQTVFDFNCGGLWRAWYDNGIPRVMVFRDEYNT